MEVPVAHTIHGGIELDKGHISMSLPMLKQGLWQVSPLSNSGLY